MTDSEWRWLIVTEGDWWWLLVTDGYWRWLTVTHWWLVSVTDGDLPWSTRVWRSDQKFIVRTREGQLKAVKLLTTNFSIVIPHGTGSRVQVKNKTIPPLGASLYRKVVSEFWFGHPNCLYTPKNAKTGRFSNFGGTGNGILGARIKILRPLFNTN